MPARYRSVREEAERLGVSQTLILEAIRERALPHRRLGKRILLDPEEVDAYLAQTGVDLEEAIGRSSDGLM